MARIEQDSDPVQSDGPRAGFALSLQLKLLLLFLALAVLPITAQAIVGRRNATDLLTKSAYQGLQAAAARSALRLDEFVNSRLEGVERAARLPLFTELLRDQGREPQAAKVAAERVLSALMAQEPVFASSATLFDHNGQVLASTAPDPFAREEGARRFFEEVMETGAPLTSHVLFDHNDRPHLYFGAPILVDQAPLGMLRLRYEAGVLQQQILLDTGILGSESFPVLFDENHLCLAHGGSAPGTDSPLLYRFPRRPDSVHLQTLAASGRIPHQSDTATLTFDLAALDQGLAGIEPQALGFTTPLPTLPDRPMASSVASMQNRPWQVAFFQPVDVFIDPIRKSERSTIYRGAGLILLVSVLALLLLRRLTNPIRELTTIARNLGQGALSVRAQVKSGDEVGSLAAAFNGMASSLQRRVESQAFIASISRKIINANNEALAVAICGLPGELARFFGADWASIIGFSDRSRWAPRCVYRSAFGASSCRPQPEHNPSEADYKWLAHKLKQQSIVHESEIDRRSWQQAGLRSMLAAPLLQGTHVFGVLYLASGKSHSPWGEGDEQVLSLVAEIISRAIQRRESEEQIRTLNDSLERRVIERTEALQTANRQLKDEVGERIRLQAERDAIHDQLYDVARQAGMAEVATTVLHNVGNALNSVGVTAHMLYQALRDSQILRVRHVAKLLRDHDADLATYLTTGKGALLPRYLDSLADKLEIEHADMVRELEELRESLEHANQIVRAQQSIAIHVEEPELRPPAALMDDAYRICSESLNRNGIKIEFNYAPVPSLYVMRHKVVQILVNLLNNAKDAVLSDSVLQRHIELRLDIVRFDDLSPDRYPLSHLPDTPTDDDQPIEAVVGFHVIDSGIGIANEHRDKLFRYGFTTKPNGHGFGLHSCALAARDLGGWLSVQSNGPSQGAHFTLNLLVSTPDLPAPPVTAVVSESARD